MRLKLLVTPLAKGAWFDQRLDVALEEVALAFPGVEARPERRFGLELVDVELPEAALPRVARLSFLQAAFEADGERLRPLDLDPGFVLPEELLAERYPGKTHELLTALAVSVAAEIAAGPPKLLDPVAGRGTTLLTAARLGIPATGVERDPSALEDFRRIVKKRTKLSRIKHKITEGAVSGARFVQFAFPDSAVRLVAGDSRQLPDLLGGERFSLVVGDLPYGVQHRGPRGTRDPTDELAACAPGWAASLRPGGAMVLAFNAFLPRRDVLVGLFVAQGLEEIDRRFTHRMSESIERQLAVFRKP